MINGEWTLTPTGQILLFIHNKCKRAGFYYLPLHIGSMNLDAICGYLEQHLKECPNGK